jgi:hypothetical protein
MGFGTRFQVQVELGRQHDVRARGGFRERQVIAGAAGDSGCELRE